MKKSESLVKSGTKLGPVEVTQGQDTPSRMAILLWGPATAGKTTFSATAPGGKLWLSFGDNEHTPVVHRNDVAVANLSSMGFQELFTHAKGDNPFGLDDVLSQNEKIETVVCDSLTALTFRALQKSVADGNGASSKFRPTMETPGLSAYGGRNALVLTVMTGLLKVTARHGVHIIFTAHEDDPHTRQEGGKEFVEYISIMLGGRLVNNMTWRLSEIWYMSQAEYKDKSRRLAFRATRLRKPMKTRMFSDKGAPEFDLKYDADKPDKGQMTIASWYEAWCSGGCVKLGVPK